MNIFITLPFNLMVLPGETVSHLPDIPSHNTYCQDNRIISSVLGTPVKINKVVLVNHIFTKLDFFSGDIVIGRIRRVINGRLRVDLGGWCEGIIGVSSISNLECKNSDREKNNSEFVDSDRNNSSGNNLDGNNLDTRSLKSMLILAQVQKSNSLNKTLTANAPYHGLLKNGVILEVPWTYLNTFVEFEGDLSMTKKIFPSAMHNFLACAISSNNFVFIRLNYVKRLKCYFDGCFREKRKIENEKVEEIIREIDSQ